MASKRLFILTHILLIIFGLSVTTHAELINRGMDSLGNRLIYDNDLNITWYDYTSPQDTWATQVNWAGALDVYFAGTHYTDWRLPTTVDGLYVYGYDGNTTAGFNITSSEMGHLFYTELGNKGYVAADGTELQPGSRLIHTGDFQNLEADAYWSGTEYAADTRNAWLLTTFSGYQDIGGKVSHAYAIAVRPGDVAIVPEPISSIDIDIKPESYPNIINLKSNGVIPVAILTTDDFDATTVDPLSVSFGPNDALEAHGKGHIQDVDGDGDLDLMLHFKTQAAGIECEDTEVGLTGKTFDGQIVEGFDSIHIVKC